jgi:hypothetical protein
MSQTIYRDGEGANVLPALTVPADTLAAATATITANDADSTISWSYTIATLWQRRRRLVGIVLGGATQCHRRRDNVLVGPVVQQHGHVHRNERKDCKIATYPIADGAPWLRCAASGR